jgi:hypothetical protein
MAKLSRKEVLRYLGGTPDQVGADLVAFTEAAKVLSSDHPRLIHTHPMQWIGVFEGTVAASDVDYDGLMAQLADKGIPPSQTIVRFIDKTEKTLIL